MSIATPQRSDTRFDQKTWPWFPIVMLHRVTDVTPVPNPYDLCRSQDELDLIIQTLRRQGFQIVSLKDAVEAHARGEDVRHYACLTFDDGYRDFLTHAWPVLKRNAAPATVFLVAERLGGFNTWDFGVPGLEKSPLLDRNEVLQLAAEGVEFGSHSATHPRISTVPPFARAPEIEGSKKTLEALLGREVALFAYPHIDQDEEAQRQVAAAGYLAAVGGEQQAHAQFVLHRVELSRMDAFSMRMRLGGWRYRAQHSAAYRLARLVKSARKPTIKA